MNGHSQRGISLISVLIIGAFAVFLLLIGFRAVPAVTEFMAVERIFKTLATSGDNGASIAELRRDFDKRGEIDNVRSITGADLVITKDSGRTMIEADYEARVPVAGVVSLVIEFHAKSTD